MKKIGYFGTPQHSADLLARLHAAGYDITFVVTNPDKPAGRKKIMTPSPVKEFAVQHNLPLFQFPSVKNAEAVTEITRMEADIYIVYAYGKLIPKEIFNHPPLGTINLHGSLLPLLRGASPVQSAILQDFRETGISLQYIVEELDAGNIISSKKFPIEERDTTGSLFGKMTEEGYVLLHELLQKESDGRYDSVPQNHSEATHCGKLANDDRRLDFSGNIRSQFNKIRSFNPPPYAYTEFRSKRVNIITAEIQDKAADGRPGEIIIVDKKQFAVNCGDQQLLITELQPEGKKIMSSSEFLNGFRPQKGEKFT